MPRHGIHFPRQETHRMLVYLDSVIVIYAVEGLPLFQTRAQARLAGLCTAGAGMAISPLTRLECRVKPMELNLTALLANYDNFLGDPALTSLPFSDTVFERATGIRAVHKYELADSLHFAVAAEHKCDVFLTNDHRLAAYPGISIEVLP